MILTPTNRRIIRPYDKPSFEHTQRYGLIKGHWANVGRVLFLLFNEGSGGQVFDLSGNGNEMDFVNSPIWSPGKFGSAILFDDGSSQYLQRESAVITDYPFTLACWYNTNDAAAEQVLIWVGDKDVVDYWTCIYLSAGDDKLYAFSHAYGGTYRYAISSTTFSTGVWEHVAGVFVSASERHIYHNGILRGSNTQACGAMANHDRTVIGGARDSTPESYMSGYIDLPVIYNRDLSASEIALLYREPFLGIERRAAPVYFFVPTVGVQDYTRGDVATLPTDDTDLETEFASGDYNDVDVDDATRVAQTAVGEFAAFLFKDKHTQQEQINVTWNGQSDRAPSDSTVYLQIYNRNTPAWETLDSDSVAAANTDFNLVGAVSSDLSYYFDANFWIACRVYQEAV